MVDEAESEKEMEPASWTLAMFEHDRDGEEKESDRDLTKSWTGKLGLFHFVTPTTCLSSSTMSTFKVPKTKQEQKPRDSKILPGDQVLLRLPNGEVKNVKVEKNACVRKLCVWGDIFLTNTHRNISIGKFGSFYANELVDQPYGLTYEISEKKLKHLPPRTIEEVGTTPRSLLANTLSFQIHRGHWCYQRTYKWRRICTTVDCTRNPSVKTIWGSCHCEFSPLVWLFYFSLQWPDFSLDVRISSKNKLSNMQTTPWKQNTAKINIRSVKKPSTQETRP